VVPTLRVRQSYEMEGFAHRGRFRWFSTRLLLIFLVLPVAVSVLSPGPCLASASVLHRLLLRTSVRCLQVVGTVQ
jgi:hypothetical protein